MKKSELKEIIIECLLEEARDLKYIKDYEESMDAYFKNCDKELKRLSRNLIKMKPDNVPMSVFIHYMDNWQKERPNAFYQIVTGSW